MLTSKFNSAAFFTQPHCADKKCGKKMAAIDPAASVINTRICDIFAAGQGNFANFYTHCMKTHHYFFEYYKFRLDLTGHYDLATHLAAEPHFLIILGGEFTLHNWISINYKNYRIMFIRASEMANFLGRGNKTDAIANAIRDVNIANNMTRHGEELEIAAHFPITLYSFDKFLRVYKDIMKREIALSG